MSGGVRVDRTLDIFERAVIDALIKLVEVYGTEKPFTAHKIAETSGLAWWAVKEILQKLHSLQLVNKDWLLTRGQRRGGKKADRAVWLPNMPNLRGWVVDS